MKRQRLLHQSLDRLAPFFLQKRLLPFHMRSSSRYASAIALVFLCLLGLSVVPKANAFQDTITLKQISSDLGLPASTVKAVIQDKRGVVWIGLEAGGLSKYNGNEFRVFQNDPSNPKSLTSDYVNSLFEDSLGNLWVGTESGLNLLDDSRESFTHFGVEEGISGQIILDIEEDANRRLWVATENGISRIDLNTLEIEPQIHIPSPAGLTSQLCNALYRDSYNRIWIATRTGVFRFSPENNQIDTPIELANAENRDSTREYFDIAEDSAGNFWLGHQTGLSLIERRTGDYMEINLAGEGQDPKSTNVATLLVDSRGYLWVATFSDGLRIIDPNTRQIHAYRPNPFNRQGLQSSSIRSLYEDRNGLIWIGTKYEGIFIYNRDVETFTRMTGTLENDGQLHGSHVLSIEQGEGDVIWIGTKRGGLNAFDRSKKTFTAYFQTDEADSLFDNRIEAILRDGPNELWLGTEKGISHFNTETKTFKNHPTHIVRDILPKDSQTLYVGTNFGLQTFDKRNGDFHDFPPKNGMDISPNSKIEVKTLFKSSSGHIYIGTHHNGLYVYDPEQDTIERYSTQSPGSRQLSGDMIRAIFEDTTGSIWVGTRLDGLNRLSTDESPPQVYDEQSGLPSNTIFSIAEDRLNRLWLTTDSGVCILNIRTNEITSFTQAHGLQSDVFEPNAICKTSSGQLLIGGDGGFNIFQPETIRKHTTKSEVIISSISILGENIAQQEIDNQELSLPHDKNYISFAFALTDYSLPGKNEFSYKLESLDPDWIYSGRRNYATYTSLSPGKYRFLVRGRLPSGEWQTAAASFAITIHPPFWKTKSFVFSSTSAGIILLVSIYFTLTRRQRWHAIRLEETVKQRTSELEKANTTLIRQSERIQLQNEELEAHRVNLEEMVFLRTQDLEDEKRKAEESDRLKSSFLANMSHEIRTPMNAIIGFSSIISEVDIDEAERKDYSKLIQKNCSALLNLIDDILDISRIEAGQLKIEKRPFDLSDLVLELSSVFSGQIQKTKSDAFKLQLLGSLEETPHCIVTDPDRLRQILTNLISNAIKFTDEGHVSLAYRFDEKNRLIHFEVKDTGIGISPESLDVIWDRFRKIEDNNEQLYRGTGLGLSITKNLVQLLGGDISAESTVGKGTTFRFHIPWLESIEEIEKPAPKNNVEVINNSSAKPLPPGKTTILVAEDEDSNYLVISRMLSREPVELVRAKNGREAIEICKQHADEIGLVFMDIKMPELDGKAATQEIKSNSPELCIIACTAYATKTEREEIMRHGFDGYLSKPITPESVGVALQRYLYSKSS